MKTHLAHPPCLAGCFFPEKVHIWHTSKSGIGCPTSRHKMQDNSEQHVAVALPVSNALATSSFGMHPQLAQCNDCQLCVVTNLSTQKRTVLVTNLCMTSSARIIPLHCTPNPSPHCRLHHQALVQQATRSKLAPSPAVYIACHPLCAALPLLPLAAA